jgi:hypothetical protein
MDVLAGEPVRGGDQDYLELGHRRSVAQRVEPGAVEARTAVALIEVNALTLKRAALPLGIPLEPPNLLIRLLGLRLARGRNPSVNPLLSSVRRLPSSACSLPRAAHRRRCRYAWSQRWAASQRPTVVRRTVQFGFTVALPD